MRKRVNVGKKKKAGYARLTKPSRSRFVVERFEQGNIPRKIFDTIVKRAMLKDQADMEREIKKWVQQWV